MKSECFEKEQLMAYATKLLEPAEEAEVQAHLAGGCETCRAMVKHYRAVESVLGEWKPTEPSPWFDARLRAAIASGASSGRARGALASEWGRRTRWLTPTLAAALVVVVSVVAVHVGRTGHFGKGAGNTIAQQGSKPAVNPPSQAGQTGITASGQSIVRGGREEPGAADAARAAEDDDMLANFDVLSELPAPPQSDKVEN